MMSMQELGESTDDVEVRRSVGMISLPQNHTLFASFYEVFVRGIIERICDREELIIGLIVDIGSIPVDRGAYTLATPES